MGNLYITFLEACIGVTNMYITLYDEYDYYDTGPLESLKSRSQSCSRNP